MVRLNPEQVAFYQRLSKSPDGKFLISVLWAELAEIEHAMRNSDGAEMHRQQGEARCLDRLIANISNGGQQPTRGVVTRPLRVVSSVPLE
jgi:hypothetical protein